MKTLFFHREKKIEISKVSFIHSDPHLVNGFFKTKKCFLVKKYITRVTQS